MAALDDPAVEAAYQADRAEARTAEGGPTHAQGKAAQSDGPVRFTAPSLIFASEAGRLEAGGFQPVEAYDVLLANLDPTLERTPPPEDPLEALQALPYPLVTYEVAAIMAGNNEAPDPEAAEAALIDRVADGSVIRQALGDDALWLPAQRELERKRSGSNGVRSSAGRSPHSAAASSSPLIGPRPTPAPSWPVATHRPGDGPRGPERGQPVGQPRPQAGPGVDQLQPRDPGHQPRRALEHRRA